MRLLELLERSMPVAIYCLHSLEMDIAGLKNTIGCYGIPW